MASQRSIPSLGALKRAPLNVELVAEALREAIIDGKLVPGERIKEVPLAEQLGISRGPIREALRLLEHDGLVKVVPNKGAIVPEVTTADLLEVYAMRASLGSLALHKLMRSENASPAARFDLALDPLRDAVAANDQRRAADADLAYQMAVVAAAELPRVSRQFEQLTWQVKIFISTLDISYQQHLSDMLAEVEALDAAIAAGDEERAERLWREKFERWVRDFVGRIDDSFDRDLWVALTSGAPGAS